MLYLKDIFVLYPTSIVMISKKIQLTLVYLKWALWLVNLLNSKTTLQFVECFLKNKIILVSPILFCFSVVLDFLWTFILLSWVKHCFMHMKIQEFLALFLVICTYVCINFEVLFILDCVRIKDEVIMILVLARHIRNFAPILWL